ncbi:unnamed protein product [Symbiodinium sp. CCMP2592]|nr:unnamed protein product [Symbiodinium sp. CCMP2592]
MRGPRCVVSVEEGGGRDEAGALILTQYGVPGAWSQPEEGDEAGALFLNQKVPGACSEAGALILNQYGVPGACSRGPGRRNMGFQARGLIPKKAEAGTRPELGCLKPEEGELQEEATTSSKDLLSEYVLGAWSQPEEDRGGDKAGVPILNQYGVPGARSQLEEDGGGNQAWKLKMKKGKDKVRILKTAMVTCEPHDAGKLNQIPCVVSVEEGGGRDEAGAFILTQYGVPGAWSQPEEGDEAGALILNQYVPGACSEAGALILNQYGVPGACSRGPGRRNMGFQARGLSPKKAEAGTRPELGSQVRARQGRGRSAYPQPIWGPRCESGGGDEAGALILDQRGVPGTRSRPEEGEGGDEGGALILNRYGLLGACPTAACISARCLKPEEGELQEEATTSSKDLLSEYVLGAWSQPEEDRGGDKAGSPILNCHGFPGSWSGENRSRDQAGVPILNQYGVPGARSQLEEDGGGNQAGALLLNQNRV